MGRDFDKLKRDYMRSKGIDIPLTPTAQLEVIPEEELILAETVALPTPSETLKKTTQKQLITMSMMPRRTTRKTTSKHRTPSKKTSTSKHRTPSKKTPTSKHRTPSKKTPTSKRSHDMRTMRSIRTYNTRKRTQATQAGL
jgi:Ulp1 family protease